MPHDPNWTKDEVILALELYYRVDYSTLREDDKDVISVSKELNQLPIHALDARDNRFRNPSGVRMKLRNFAAIDPNYKGKGLWRASKLDRAVWAEFWSDKERLVHTARKIREHYAQFSTPRTQQEQKDQWDDDEEFAEGRILTRVHKQRERNSAMVRKKKRQVLEQTGRLACECCGFDFEETYGELGRGFAECHHTVPLPELKRGQKTKLSELAIVCANCHRMLHRGSNPLTIRDLKSLLRLKSKRAIT